MSETPATNDSVSQNVTTLGETYEIPKYDFSDPNGINEKSGVIAYGLPNKKLLDTNFIEVGEVKDFPTIPNPNLCSSYEDFLQELKKWKASVSNFCQKSFLPQTLSHTIPRPVPPDIISKSDMEDLAFMRRMKRNFDPETSPPNPANQIAFEDILFNGTPFTDQDFLPYQGFNEKPVPVRAHLSNTLTWNVRLLPKRPHPIFYSSFEEYESAILKWADYVYKTVALPPSPKQIGQMIKQPKEGSRKLMDPPIPEYEHPMPSPICNYEANSRTTRHNLKKLTKSYKKFLITSTTPQKSSKSNAFKTKTFTPPHSPSITAAGLCQHYIDYGTPFSNVFTTTPTQCRRIELMTMDIGFMADQDLNEPSSVSVKMDAPHMISLVKNNIIQFLLTDLSPRQLLSLLYEEYESESVGKKLIECLPIEKLVRLSMISTSFRFLSRCSIICQYFLGFRQTTEQVLKLDMEFLERFVSLIIFTTPYSIPLNDLPDEEISAAIAASPKSDNQIDMLANDVRQAQLLLGFQSLVFSSPERFLPCQSFLRILLHKTYSKISEMVTSDVYFPLIKEGFVSRDPLAHMFYFRVFRTFIQIQYSRLIRVLGIHDLIPFFYDCIGSSNPLVRSHSLSLWQMMLHTDSSLALRMQILKSTSSSIVRKLRDNSSVFQECLYNVFTLYRRNESEFDYRPFPISQYKSYLEAMAQDLASPFVVKTLELLLSLASDQQSIYSQNENELKDFMNKFTQSLLPTLKRGGLIRCMKIVFKSNLLEPSTVNIPEIWDYLFSELLSKNAKIETRMELWKTFRNAVLHQKGFVSFIMTNPELSKKLGEAFSSYDESISACMILVLPALAKPIHNPQSFSTDESIRTNLKELFLKLSDPSVLISGRLLAAYMSSNNNSLMARVHSCLSNFLKILLTSHEGSPLKEFLNARHVQESLGKVFQECAMKSTN